MVFLNPRDVLDYHVGGTEHLCGANHAKVELVLGVRSSSVVVQIGVTLTRWTPNQEVHMADCGFECLFAPRERRTELAIEEALNRLPQDSLRWTMVLRECGSCMVIYVGRPHQFEATAESTRSLANPIGQLVRR